MFIKFIWNNLPVSNYETLTYEKYILVIKSKCVENLMHFSTFKLDDFFYTIMIQ